LVEGQSMLPTLATHTARISRITLGGVMSEATYASFPFSEPAISNSSADSPGKIFANMLLDSIQPSLVQYRFNAIPLNGLLSGVPPVRRLAPRTLNEVESN